MKNKTLIFDIDGTLTKSKMPLDPEMAELLGGLLVNNNVAIISGGSLAQFKGQLVAYLEDYRENWDKLFLLPTSGAMMYVWNKNTGNWEEKYSNALSIEEKEDVIDAITETLEDFYDEFSIPRHFLNEQLEDRGPQMTFSALGQRADYEDKKKWDPDYAKRKTLQKILQEKLPNLSVKVGGSTSVDITRDGIDKAFGIKNLLREQDINKKDAIFYGDEIFPDGNDYPAVKTGVDIVEVKDPDDTKGKLREILSE